MTDALQTFTFSSSGLFSPRHTVSDSEGNKLGELKVQRNRWGLISRGTYRPEKGEVLQFKRDPGLLRAQFSMWTEDREWLASSLRWSFFTRPITIHTGTKPQTLMPLPGFRSGWKLMAPKTGEMARLEGGLLSSKSRLEVFRRMDFELVLFAYFLGSLTKVEFLWPGPVEHRVKEAQPSPSSSAN
jgi:hypothetical protein